MKKMNGINIDKWRVLNKTLFDAYISTYKRLEESPDLNAPETLVNSFEEQGILETLTKEGYGSAYTIARELGIYYEEDGKYMLSKMSKSYIEGKLTYQDYIKYYCLNIEFLINNEVVHPFLEILESLKDNAYDKNEIAHRCLKLVPSGSAGSVTDCLRLFLNRCVEGELLSYVDSKYKLNYSYNLLKGSLNKSNYSSDEFERLFITGDQKIAQKNVVQLLLEREVRQLFEKSFILINDNPKNIKHSNKKTYTSNFNLDLFIGNIEESGLNYLPELLYRFIASLLTKPFVILTGLSGSGKTKLAQAFVHWICQDESQYRIIPVGADWTNREPLLGYPNALKPEEYVKPDSGVLGLIIQANHQPDLPHFLILDEMNLSHVERYFADFLSVMESKEEIPLHSGEIENGVPAKLKVPSNLFIIGTVNIDETTNMFSPKVLDRANTIEFRVTQDEMKNFLGNIRDINMDALTEKGAGMAKSFLDMAANKDFATDGDINAALVQFFGELKKTGAEFGYRSATEILRLIHQLTVLDASLTKEQKIDIAIMQKLLPKLHGSRRKLCPVLETLGSFCVTGDVKIVKDVFEKPDFDYNGANVLYPLSLEKISRMYRGAIDNGFASFAEA